MITETFVVGGVLTVVLVAVVSRIAWTTWRCQKLGHRWLRTGTGMRCQRCREELRDDSVGW